MYISPWKLVVVFGIIFFTWKLELPELFFQKRQVVETVISTHAHTAYDSDVQCGRAFTQEDDYI